MSEKRKRHVVTIEQKLNALERLDKGESVKRICDELKVGKSTVNDWRKNRKSFQDFCTQVESNSKTLTTRCTLRKPTNELVDDALWLWFQQERRRGTPLSGPILKEKAILLHSKIEDGGQFSASEGWLTRWKKRHGVHFIGVCGEKMSADTLAANELPTKFQEYISNRKLHPEQVYNMDETGLNFKMLPQKTFATSQEKSAAGFKTNKERITVAVCSNATGTHKIPLFVIGKAMKPRAFKNINSISSLPVYYRAQKSAWMATHLFKEWFVTEFVPRVKKHLESLKMEVKAVLVLDNAPTHPDEEIQCEDAKDIRIYYLPAHTTSLLQPMDQGVIASLKKRYRHKLLSEILSKLDVEGDTGIITALKTINIKDAIYMVARAFEEMPSTTFVKSWRKMWPGVMDAIENNNEDNPVAAQNSTEPLEPDDNSMLNDFQNLPQCETMTVDDMNEWITGDDDLENEFFTDDEIVQAVVAIDDEDSEKEEDIADENVERISHAEAKSALEFITAYIEQQEVSTPADVMFVKKWRDYAFKRTINTKKQKRINDYFKS